jgi:uncharacterized protein
MTRIRLNSTQIKSTAIAVFVKTPGLSPVKTRLAASIGTAAAEEFYKLCTEAIQKSLSSAKESMDIVPFWAVGEQAGLDHPLWQSFESIHTGEGDLGERQHHIYQYLQSKYQRVILIGADSPQLCARHLNDAITALDNHQFALGPAVDGGYYLFAGRVPIAKDIWTNITYSAADTARQLLAKLPATVATLDMLTDVDRIDDLRVLKAELRAQTDLSDTLRQLVRWLETYQHS